MCGYKQRGCVEKSDKTFNDGSFPSVLNTTCKLLNSGLIVS